MFVDVKLIAARSLPAYAEKYSTTAGAVWVEGVWREVLDVWTTENYADATRELDEEYGRRVFDMLDAAADGAVVVRHMVAEESNAGFVTVADRLVRFMPAELLQVQVPAID